jgi:inner membrane protein
MLTIQGIPLFYPLMRNPCVIPANPSLRFRSGNLKSEAMALFFFTMILVSAYDLFANGFWTTYNRSFGTIKHISREFGRQKSILKVHYDFWKYDHHLIGDAFVINSDEYSTTFYKKDSLFFIENNDNSIRNVNLLPVKSDIIFSPKELDFNFISSDSLNSLLNNVILKAVIHSNSKFMYHGKISDKIELKFKLHPFIDPLKTDSISTENLKIDSEISKVYEKIYIAQRLDADQRQEQKNINKEMKILNSELKKNLSIYKRNKLEKRLILLAQKLKKILFKNINTDIYYDQIDLLSKQKNKKNTQYFNGSILYLDKHLFDGDNLVYQK